VSSSICDAGPAQAVHLDLLDTEANSSRACRPNLVDHDNHRLMDESALFDQDPAVALPRDVAQGLTPGIGDPGACEAHSLEDKDSERLSPAWPLRLCLGRVFGIGGISAVAEIKRWKEILANTLRTGELIPIVQWLFVRIEQPEIRAKIDGLPAAHSEKVVATIARVAQEWETHGSVSEEAVQEFAKNGWWLPEVLPFLPPELRKRAEVLIGEGE
jgi:hypothetical protein